MLSNAIRRHAPFWISIFAGIALWEIAGRSTSKAFMVPFSETLVRLWQLMVSGNFLTQLLNSAKLFLAGFILALIVGMPLGMLLARIRMLRIGVEPYIMILYATPMVALIPFILSMMGFGFAPKLLVVFLFAVFPVLYNTVEGARSIKPELIEVAKSFRSSEWALWREVMLPYTLPYTMTGVRQAIGRALVGMIAAEFFLSATGLGQLIMSASQNFDTGGRVRFDPGHRPARCRFDTARPRPSNSISPAGDSSDGRAGSLPRPSPRRHKPTVEPLVRHLCAAADHGTCDHPCLGDRGSRSPLRLTSQSRRPCCSRFPRSSPNRHFCRRLVPRLRRWPKASRLHSSSAPSSDCSWDAAPPSIG